MTEASQQKLPLAFLNGEAVVEKPEDLYIPPDALEVILDTFEGPLDLLLYLIKRHKLDIVELPILKITEQYVTYVDMMKELKLELAAEYLVMAALLAQIKSRMLLPVHEEFQEEEDPRAELVRRLQEYELFKSAAEKLDEIPRLERDIFVATAKIDTSFEPDILLPDTSLKELLVALSDVMSRAKAFEHHHISKEVLSTRERMSHILALLSEAGTTLAFSHFFDVDEGRSGVVVTFIAMLELVKESLISIVQANVGGQVYLSLYQDSQ
ncbi:segregation and condensation protein A [Pseudoalteromonas xiamenensis]|uniref:Segregation and condensation protein A n=1 Tax=Pseudoalteromonas xiamenensis TaxID=882626 RepID=A0A975HKW2_9GAMM|nr:segregation/condensation protein A [Pseudoalteromonas xiamenensis]QTH71456.1 segregation/condensation protein A [Pseudoalteromonas xiamenensis]